MDESDSLSGFGAFFLSLNRSKLKGANTPLARTEVIEEVPLLPVNDHLAPAQLNELVLGQEAEQSLLMPDE